MVFLGWVPDFSLDCLGFTVVLGMSPPCSFRVSSSCSSHLVSCTWFLVLRQGKGFACRCLTLVRRPTVLPRVLGEVSPPGGWRRRRRRQRNLSWSNSERSKGNPGTHRSPSLANQTKLHCVSQLAWTGPVRDDEESSFFVLWDLLGARGDLFRNLLHPLLLMMREPASEGGQRERAVFPAYPSPNLSAQDLRFE